MTSGWVYFIAPPDLSKVKIGYSRDPYRRIILLRYANPTPLDLLGYVAGDRAHEAALHIAFIEYHSHFEWFNGHPDLLARIDKILDDDEIPPELLPKPGQGKPFFKVQKRTPEQRAHMRDVTNAWRAARRHSA